MVMLTDLLERKRALEEEEARIARKLAILRQIDDLATQLDDPELVVEPDPPEPGPEHAVRAATEAPPKPAEAPPAPPPPKQPAPPATAEPEASSEEPAKRRRSTAEEEKVLSALAYFRGEALQIDIVKKSGMSSGQTSQVCAQLEADGKIKCVGRGGYQGKSKRWRLADAPVEPHAMSARVRKAIQRDATSRDRQPPTHEGRILSLLMLNRTMTVPELAAELGIPASTVGRLIAKLKAEGEVVDPDNSGQFRRVMS